MGYSPHNQDVISARNAEIMDPFLRILDVTYCFIDKLWGSLSGQTRLRTLPTILCRWSSSGVCANAVSYFPSQQAKPWVGGILPRSISDFTVFRKKSLFRKSLSASP
jgi:hypothetical protein